MMRDSTCYLIGAAWCAAIHLASHAVFPLVLACALAIIGVIARFGEDM